MTCASRTLKDVSRPTDRRHGRGRWRRLADSGRIDANHVRQPALDAGLGHAGLFGSADITASSGAPTDTKLSCRDPVRPSVDERRKAGVGGPRGTQPHTRRRGSARSRAAPRDTARRLEIDRARQCVPHLSGRTGRNGPVDAQRPHRARGPSRQRRARASSDGVLGSLGICDDRATIDVPGVSEEREWARAGKA